MTPRLCAAAIPLRLVLDSEILSFQANSTRVIFLEAGGRVDGNCHDVDASGDQVVGGTADGNGGGSSLDRGIAGLIA